MKKRIKASIVVAGLLVVGVATTAIWYTLQLRALRPDDASQITFVYQRGTELPALAEQLQDQGLIRSKTAFVWYVVLSGSQSSLQAGSYDFSPSDRPSDMVEAFVAGAVSSNRVTIPEGANLQQIAKLAVEKGIDAGEMAEALKQPRTDAVLVSRPAGSNSLEGYLFPDTYSVAKPTSANALVQQMLNGMARKLSDGAVVKGMAAQGLNLHQGLTLASIVEKEVPKPEDRRKVAQVFLNRLKAGMPLQTDATLVYVANQTNTPFNLQVESPYNSYKYTGLPPGPIASPSFDSMQAVANPTATDALYFVNDTKGNTYFAKTFPEHQKNVDKYLGK